MSHFILRPDGTDRDRMAAAYRFAREFIALGKAVKVDVTEYVPKRSSDQNARMWALLTDISTQVEWPVDGRMERLTPEDWKDVFSASLRKGQRVAQGIEGGFVMLGARTSRMTVAEMSDLQELICAFGAERGVRWSDPAFRQEARRAA